MKAKSTSVQRGGFTLMELMVVITIIAALMAMAASAVMKFMTVQQSNNTLTTLNKVQSILNRQWSAAKDQAKIDSIPSSVQTYILANLTGTDANVMTRMRVIYIKLKMRELFPMNFNEALNPAPLPPLPAYVSYLGKLGVTGSTGAAYESAACLLMALQRAQSGGASGASADLSGGGSSTSIALPSGQSIKILADAWRQPIYFTRVPAGCSLVNLPPSNVVPGGGQPGIHDPGDPQGYLNANAWKTTANTGLFTTLTLQPLAGPDCSYNLVPMLASGGMNKKLSDPVYFSTTQVIDNDNLYSTP